MDTYLATTYHRHHLSHSPFISGGGAGKKKKTMATLAFFSGALLHPLPGRPTRQTLLMSSSCCSCSSGVLMMRQVVMRSGVAGRVAVEKEEDIDGLVKFLYDDLPHLFDDQGIDRSMYDERVEFRDPITKHDSIDGYLFNIRLLKALFRPVFQLHSVKKTGSHELTTRWSMVMKFSLLPWKPDVVFTGTSIMGINPKNKKFCKHVDIWDSIENNEYFSFEGLVDFLKQLWYYKTPDLDTPKYQLLKRRSNYEVRKYSSFLVAESQGDKLSGSGGFNAVTGYIFGKNASSEKIPMTTPVFTQTADISNNSSNVLIQVVLPTDKELDKLPSPVIESVDLKKVEGVTMAAIKFSGKPTEQLVKAKEKQLRASLLNDGLKPKEGCLLARYNDPRTKSFIMRNEVMIRLDDFVLD